MSILNQLCLQGERALFFIDDVYEDLELLYPLLRLEEAGCVVTVAGLEKNKIYHGKHGYPYASNAQLDNLSSHDFDLLIIPGGFAPDQLRRHSKVLSLTKEMHEQGKLIAHICHAGWIPISANIIRGFRCTSTPGIKDDLVNAGGYWEDSAVVVDRNQISSRRPSDLPIFCREIVSYQYQCKLNRSK